MKRTTAVVFFLVYIILCFRLIELSAQDDKKLSDSNRLTSEKLDKESKDLDSQIIDLNKKIENVIVKYNLINVKDIKTLPYQITYRLGDNFIEVERHSYEKNELLDKIVKMKKKIIKIYVSGQNVTKMESIIFEKDIDTGYINEVKIIDNTPSAANTDNIIFSHISNSKSLITNKKFSEIKNTTAFTIRNDIKREFLIPHLSYFYSVLLNIAETYAKGIKDSDSTMYEFLKNSTSY